MKKSSACVAVCLAAVLLLTVCLTSCRTNKSKEDRVITTEGTVRQVDVSEWMSDDVMTRKVYVITNKAEMAEFTEAGWFFFQHRVWDESSPAKESYEPIDWVSDELLSLDDDFFRDHDMVIVLIDEGSGSIGVSLESIESREGKGVVTVYEDVPENGTGDLACWCIYSAVPKGSVDPDNATVEVVNGSSK